MQIIIDMPEMLLKYVKTHTVTDSEVDEICDCIKNGIPIPKGHGKLKDIDVIKKSWNGVETPHGMRKVVDFQVLDDAPTIIEADKEEKDAD